MTGPSAALSEVVSYLDAFLRVEQTPDAAGAVNGLQVENDGRIGRIVAAVDASQATIDGVVRQLGGGPGHGAASAPLLIVHHGLFWEGNVAVSGRRFRRLRALLAHDIAVYSAHIPLDVHPEVGNNILLARKLGLQVQGWFGNYREIAIGVWGHPPDHLANRQTLRNEVDRVLRPGDRPSLLIPGGPATTRKVGVITGAAGDMVGEVQRAGLDTFVTGEGPHHSYFDAMEWGVNLIYAGHYATESLGVQALAAHVADRFGLPWEFHDHPTGL